MASLPPEWSQCLWVHSSVVISIPRAFAAAATLKAPPRVGEEAQHALGIVNRINIQRYCLYVSITQRAWFEMPHELVPLPGHSRYSSSDSTSM